MQATPYRQHLDVAPAALTAEPPSDPQQVLDPVLTTMDERVSVNALGHGYRPRNAEYAWRPFPGTAPDITVSKVDRLVWPVPADNAGQDRHVRDTHVVENGSGDTRLARQIGMADAGVLSDEFGRDQAVLDDAAVNHRIEKRGSSYDAVGDDGSSDFGAFDARVPDARVFADGRIAIDMRGGVGLAGVNEFPASVRVT